MGLELLCTADVHLGQRTHRLPTDLDPEQYTPVAAWRALVAAARDRRPDAVLLAGDVVDEANAFFEAYGPLAAGVQALVDDGIPVIAVAGNHDHEVLGRLADEIPAFTLLGRGGRWEEVDLEREGRAVARICGWSFPARHHRESPLAAGLPTSDRPDLPRIGLLHCDVDVAASRYAPVPAAALQVADVRAWILGHVHVPSTLRAAGPLIRYCGSLQGLDPNETGAHGACRMTLDDAGAVTATLVPLARLRWEHLEVPLDGVPDRDALATAALEALRRCHDTLQVVDEPAGAVGCRLALTGRSELPAAELNGWSAQVAELQPDWDGVRYFIDRVRDRSAPALDLAALARGTDPVGLLATRLRCLERGEPEDLFQRLITEGRARLQAEVRRRRAFQQLGDPPELDADAVRELLWRAGVDLLERLQADRRVAP